METLLCYWYAHLFLGRSYEQERQLTAAIEELQKAKSIELTPETESALGFFYATNRKRVEAEKIISDLRERARSSHVPSYCIAVIYGALGEKDPAFEWLGRACDERSFYAILLNVDPELNSLRADERFAALARRLDN